MPKTIENSEYVAFLRRAIRAHGRRVADGDVEALTGFAILQTELDTALYAAVAGLRGYGYSWGEIANRLGVTRQAVHQRWGTALAGAEHTRYGQPVEVGP